MADWYDKELECFDRQVEIFDRKVGLFNRQFGSQYDQLSLENSGVCPCCGNEDLSILENKYYCSTCGHARKHEVLYSKGYASSPNWFGKCYVDREQYPTFKKLIEVKEYKVIQDQTRPLKDNLLQFKKRMVCAIPESVKLAHGSLAGILPFNYDGCADCNYDHEYDRGPAKRWHQAHPECGAFICGDDLICDD